MKQFTVTGMSCASCASRVEKAVKNVKGVTSCSVNLLTNTMGVEGNVNEEEIIESVRKAGYDAKLKRREKEKNHSTYIEDEIKDKETPKLRKRLFASLFFLLPLMYISMGHMMWDWPLPSFLSSNHIAMGLIQLLLTSIIMVINQKFFINGFKSLFHRSPNMDTLVALGATAAFIYSTFALFAMTDAEVKGDIEKVLSYMHEFYFESAAMILTLITLGKMLESYSKGKTTNALKGLMKLAPKNATLERDNKEIIVPIEEVKKGDIFVIRPGESIPVDGIILEGNTVIDESTLTGESIPVDKTIGSSVSAGTMNISGFIRCEATRVGEDTTLSQIIQMVSDASITKAPIAKVADKVSGVFVPTVIAIAIITTIVWLIITKNVGLSLSRGISVLVISCPCALGLATPVAIMVGSGMGAKNGILFKTAVSLEKTGKAQIVVLDKTGTITKGEPKVTDIIPMNDINEKELLSLAYALEKKSEHPLARAIVQKAEQEGLIASEVDSFLSLTGNGVTALLNETVLYGGSYKFISEKISITDDIKNKYETLSEEGKTPIFFVKNNSLYGIIAVADTIKEDSPQAIKEMQNMGMHVVMLTGDNERTAKAIGLKVNVNEVIAGVLPNDKENVISKLKEKGTVIMVGDGINDAPALTSADIGIAIGAGSDIALDAADVVLMKSSLSDVPSAIRLSRATLKNIHENLFWAFIYNIIGIPLASGIFINIFGWQLNPMFAAAAMSLSSFCVVANALRLNLFKMHDSSKDHRIMKKMKSNDIKEEKNMEKTLSIEGMMCAHCEMHVKKALESLDEVNEVEVSYKKGEAHIKLGKDISNDILIKAITDQGYTVTDIK